MNGVEAELGVICAEEPGAKAPNFIFHSISSGNKKIFSTILRWGASNLGYTGTNSLNGVLEMPQKNIPHAKVKNQKPTQMKNPTAAQTSPAPRQRYEERLRQREKELEQALASTVAQALASNVGDAQDVADQAVAGYQKEMLFSQGTVRNAQLRLVRQALGRIADGSYGDCVRCLQAIGPKRIEALPWTPYCIDCQERIEKGEIESSAVA
jgi:DnaK suppressor protein